MTAELRRLWQEAFGDSEETLDAFFATGFSEDRFHYILDKGVPVSALYWFDCCLGGYKLAYLYAVATAKSHRGRGLARRLIEETHSILKAQGYAGAILVPGTAELFGYYEKMGYRKVTQIREFTCGQGQTSVLLREIDAKEYADLRKQYLPAGGVVQEGSALSFLQTYTKFYEGRDFLLAAGEDNGVLIARELLGNAHAAPAILCALGFAEGRFRTPETGRAFAMFLPLEQACPTPAYFGLALD